MSTEPPPLDADVRDLLDRARAKDVEDLGAEHRAAILGAVMGSVASLSPAIPPGSASAAVARATRTLTLLATFSAGVGAGVAVDRVVAPPVVVVAPSAAPVPTTPPRAPAPAETTAAIPVNSLPDVRAPAHAPFSPPLAPAAPPPSSRGLAAERALLDVARSALARGEAQEALDATLRHEGEYPAGSLKEEREAIAIRALVALGRRDEARARGAAFEREFPNGLSRAAVKGALDGSLE